MRACTGQVSEFEAQRATTISTTYKILIGVARQPIWLCTNNKNIWGYACARTGQVSEVEVCGGERRQHVTGSRVRSNAGGRDRCAHRGRHLARLRGQEARQKLPQRPEQGKRLHFHMESFLRASVA